MEHCSMEDKKIEDIIKEKGFYVATVVGDSMMPMLHNKKDLVKIVPADSNLKENDIPLYKRPTGEYVLHRIIAVKRKYYIICGDNRTHKENVPFDWIVGVLEEFERNGATYKTDNAEYLNYVDKMRKTFWKRKLKNIVIKIKRKIRGK